MKMEKETRAKENFWAVLCPKALVCPSIYLDVSFGGKIEDVSKLQEVITSWNFFSAARRELLLWLPIKTQTILTKLISSLDLLQMVIQLLFCVPVFLITKFLYFFLRIVFPSENGNILKCCRRTTWTETSAVWDFSKLENLQKGSAWQTHNQVQNIAEEK